MRQFTEQEIKDCLNVLITELENNLNTDQITLSNSFPYERNESRIEKPRFNIIKNYHTPVSYKIETEFMPDAAGKAKWIGKRIILDDDLTPIESIKTLIHEWSHMRMHLTINSKKLNQNIEEIEAESSAFIIMTLLGLLDNKDEWSIKESISYVLRYSKQTDQTLEEIYKFSGKRIIRNVNHILNKYLCSVYPVNK